MHKIYLTIRRLVWYSNLVGSADEAGYFYQFIRGSPVSSGGAGKIKKLPDQGDGVQDRKRTARSI